MDGFDGQVWQPPSIVDNRCLPARGFERASPKAHQRFLEFLNLPDAEIATLRARCRAESALPP
jgi:hypothetical protein